MLASCAMLAAGCCSNQEKGCCGCDNGVDNPTIQTIMSRKSVRSYTEQPIEPEKMEVMLKAAMAAPTGMNIQPWSFVVLTEKENFAKIFGERDFNMRIYKTAAALVVFCADTTITRPPRENPDGAPVTTPNQIWRDDMGACTENFLLAAESLGLGAVWTACYPFPERFIPLKAALDLPDNVLPYSVVAVGYPAGDDQPKEKWKPERIHYEKW